MGIENIDGENLSVPERIYLDFIREGDELRRELDDKIENPMKYNYELLMRILEDNKDTEYGRKYDFENIRSIEDYQKKVPITTYDDYAEYIYRMTEKGERNLLTDYEIIHYAMSSGTMGNPKRIPISFLTMDIIRKYNYAYWFSLAAEKHGIDWISDLFFNLIEVSSSKLKSGDPYGAISGKIVSSMGDEFLELMTSPIEAVMPNVETNTRYVHVRFALANKNIPYVYTAFVSVFLESLRYIKDNWEMLVQDIENGTIDESVKMPKETRESLLSKIEPMPERALELRKIFEEGFDEPIVPKIWPKMFMLIGIGTGSFSDYLEKIKDFTGPDFDFMYLGLTASEGFFTMPIGLNEPKAVPIVDAMFFEFLPVEANEDFSKVVTLDQLEEGKEYEVITTNISGFYRYRMKDIIRCTGKYKGSPIIEFSHRSDQFLSLMGEKVNEDRLRVAAYNTERDLGFDLIDFSVYTDYDSSPMRYVYLMEIADLPEGLTKEILQEKLNENLNAVEPFLGNFIEKGAVGKTGLYFLQPETYLFYKELRVARGTSSAQVKPPRILRDEPDIRFFNALLDDELN